MRPGLLWVSAALQGMMEARDVCVSGKAKTSLTSKHQALSRNLFNTAMQAMYHNPKTTIQLSLRRVALFSVRRLPSSSLSSLESCSSEFEPPLCVINVLSCSCSCSSSSSSCPHPPSPPLPCSCACNDNRSDNENQSAYVCIAWVGNS